MLRKLFILASYLVVSSALTTSAAAQTFKFPEEGSEDNSAERERNAKVAAQLSTPCRNTIKNQKIMVLIAESRNGVINAKQAQYNQHIHTINDGLKALGLKTYTQEQIRAQVAQAEIDAYFKNDPDAALGASKRLAANYVLRGLIETDASRNLVINVNQININMSFTLSGPDGRVISQANANNASYAGSDVRGMALDLVRESAQEVLGQLYSDYCTKAGKR